MSKFPTDFDDDTTLPFVNDNITEIGGDAINALRDAVFAIEQNIGLGAAGTTNSLAERFGVSINPNGTIKTSAIASMGLVTLPIRQDQIAEDAEIPESKLRLDHRTQDLFNYIRDLSGDVNLAIGWISTTGIKLEPHLIGAIYRHTMDQIDVSGDPIGFPFLKNKFRQFRDNLQSYNLVNDINNELLAHQWADGSPFGTIKPVFTNNGSVYQSNYAHTASGIFLNTNRFSHIPQTEEDLQLFAEFVDANLINQIQTLQNLNSNGISRVSRSSTLTIDGYGQPIVPSTPVIAYLKNTGSNSSPFDDIDKGDDVIEFKPNLSDGYAFDEKFALVKIGDIVRINYGTVEVPFIIKEKKYNQNGANRKFLVRVAGKNLFYSAIASARIDRPLVNSNKFGVLATAPANNNFTQLPSLIIGSPRGAQVLGVGFSPEEFNESHYLLYVALYPTGFPQDGYTILPGIDVTGNAGRTPGAYTLDSIVESTNLAFRQAGFNYRFIAFSYQGEFGVMLADSYNNSAFSILSAVVTPEGAYDAVASNIVFQNNVVDVFPTVGHSIAPDPLGFGPYGANVASPPFMTTYGSAEASQVPTRLFVPLRKNNYYVDGIELERLNLQVGQAIDGYGDGYWVGKVQTINIFPGPIPAGRVEVTYRVPLDLSTSHLKVGKTLVVQNHGAGGFIDFGRFIISNVSFDCAPAFTDITVYDAVHGQGASPLPTLADGYVALYFNSDSVSFNTESATDFVSVGPFKRHFEIFIDSNANTNTFQNSNTFSHERGRMGISGSNLTVDGTVTMYGSADLAKLDIIRISPKLRGFQFGPVNKISLRINTYDSSTGIYDGYLASYDGINFTHIGPRTIGKQGETIRFYDETNVDYIDILLDINAVITSFSSFKVIDIQLFPTLSLDDEVMMISTCQLNDTTKAVTRVRDERQFGNTSEKDLSTSALNYIALPERLLHFNGLIRGFDIVNNNAEFLTLTGGQILVNGKFQSVNNEIITFPKATETRFSVAYPINWALCVNSVGELVAVPLTDFDSILGTPNAPNRLVVLNNVVSNTTYTVDSTSFVDLLNNRKDLCILYIVSSVVTGIGLGATVALSTKDVRRYVNDQDSSLPAVVTQGNSQGNFKNFAAAALWVKQDNAFQNTIQIKGIQSTGVDPNFTLANQINIVGGGVGSVLFFNTDIVMFNVNFKDMEVRFTGTTVLSNVNFENCTVYNGGPPPITLTINNSIMNNCSIDFDNSTTFTGVSINKSTAVFEDNVTAVDSRFTNCNLTFEAGGSFTNVLINPSTVVFSGSFDVSNFTMIDTVATVNVGILFTLNGPFRFERNTVTYNGAPGTFDATDLVNSDYGMIYIGYPTANNIFIRDNTFTTAMSNRYSFVTIQASSAGAVLENIDISKNKFITTAATDDLRAVISITSTLTSAPSGYPIHPKLVNVVIDGNVCNSNQMILISVRRLPAAAIVGNLFAVSGTRITNNTCGTIGFITTTSSASDFSNETTPNTGLIQDKPDHLIISGNTCKYIANLDHRGDYIPYRSTAFPANSIDYVQAATGAFTITNNSANWIHVGTSAYTTYPTDGGVISHNRVSPANPTYLNNFIDSFVSGVTPGNVGIILRRGYNGTDPTRNMITNNIISQKALSSSSGSNVLYYYDTAIACFTTANITGNSVIGVLNTATNPLSPFVAMLYLWSSGDVIVTGNNFNRAALSIQAYVKGQPGAVNQVNITNNIFDSQFIDAANTIETVGVDIPSAWAYRQNRNQIFYKEVNLVDNTYKVTGFVGGGVPNNAYPAHTQLDFAKDSDATPNVFLSAFRQIGPASYTEIASAHFVTVQDFLNAATSLDTKGWTRRGTLDGLLPDNVRILNARIGYFETTWNSVNTLDHTGAPFQYNVSTLTMFKYKDSTTSNDPINGVLNVRDQMTAHGGSFGDDTSVADKVTASHYISSAGDETNVRTNTVIITVDLTAHDFTTNQNYSLAYSIDQNWKLASPAVGNYVFFDWSPIVLKCIYR